MKALYSNGVHIGEYELGEDGYYVFYPDSTKGGYWNENILFYVLLQLRRLNLEWDTQFKTDPLVCGKEVEGVTMDE